MNKMTMSSVAALAKKTDQSTVTVSSVAQMTNSQAAIALLIAQALCGSASKPRSGVK